MSKKILLASQWVGEFGWELFCWQGHLRKLSKYNDKVVVISRKGHEYLYRDFCDEFIVLESPTSKANMWLGETNRGLVDEIIKKYEPTEIIKPFNIGYNPLHGSSQKFKNQEFILYKSDTLDKKYNILIHARNKIVGSNRNWNKKNWEILVDKLSNKYSVATIGSHEAYSFDGIDDYRNISIENTVSLMNRCQLVVGQSSGAMHLASLSGTKHFVWSDNTNYNRYTRDWNPFNTEVIFYKKEGWNPRIDNIYNEIIKNL